MTVGQRLLATARKALQELVANEFNREVVLEACRKAAAQGFTSCQIRPSRPVDVTGDPSLQQLRAALEKERVSTVWIPVALPGERAYKILELRWDAHS